jgi:hypothetical protein
MRYVVALAVLAGCHFRTHELTADAPPDLASIDAPGDAPADAPPDAPAPGFCPMDPHLRLCFSFDADPLPSPLPEEGSATIPAQLTNVTRIAGAMGGAALLGSTSEIYVPMDAAVSGILATEIWFRLDTDAPANFARASLFDSNIIPPNISSFVYRNDPNHDIHCGIGSQSESWTTDAVTLGVWHHGLCVCANGNLSYYLDGIDLGDRPGNCGTAGALVADGLTIGANNNGGPSGINDVWIGAIDGVRFWDQPPTSIDRRPIGSATVAAWTP